MYKYITKECERHGKGAKFFLTEGGESKCYFCTFGHSWPENVNYPIKYRIGGFNGPVPQTCENVRCNEYIRADLSWEEEEQNYWTTPNGRCLEMCSKDCVVSVEMHYEPEDYDEEDLW